MDMEAIFVAENGGEFRFQVTARNLVSNETQVEKTVKVLNVVWGCPILHLQRAADRHVALRGH
jgi:hypothetical protein